MSFSLIYVLQRLAYRAWMFVYDWYIGGWYFTWHHLLNVLESMDRYWALRVTLKNLFQPMYQDKTVLGRILGFVFRLLRIFIAIILYLAVTLIAIGGYFIWALIPIGIFVQLK